jgi:TusA-related sulfurtransferase
MKTFDLRGTILPFSFLQIVNYCKQIEPGETVEVITNDESVVADLACLLPKPSVSVTVTECGEDNGSTFRITLKKNDPSSSNKGGNSCPKSI